MEGEQISIPSLIIILVLGGLIIRYLFFGGPGSGSGGGNAQGRMARDSSAAMRTREAAVERIQQMFPQIDRRNILWDLQRNGCNIAATTERILSGRLETPPITFQPPPPPGSSTPSASGTAQSAPKPAPWPSQPDLITRYNLHDRLKETPPPEGDASGKKEKAWSSNKNERHSLLQRRRDDMILAARRKMEAKIAAEKAAAAAAAASS